MKCANCSNEALFSDQTVGLDPIDYCNDCLPKHLRAFAENGQLALRGSEKKETKKTKVEPTPEPTPEPTQTPAEAEADANPKD